MKSLNLTDTGFLAAIGGFTPASINGLFTWFDAAHINVDGGNNLITWPDKSSNHFSAFLQAGSSYIVPNAINNKPALFFDSSTDTQVYVNSFNYTNSNITVFIIGQASGGQSYGAPRLVAFMNQNLTEQDFGSIDTFTINFDAFPTLYFLRNNTYDAQNNDNGDTDVPFYIMGRRSGTNVSLDYQSTISNYSRNNGTTESNPFNIDTLTIGCNDQPQSFDGFIAEIIIYNRALSDAEVIQVQNYLTTKYAI